MLESVGFTVQDNFMVYSSNTGTYLTPSDTCTHILSPSLVAGDHGTLDMLHTFVSKLHHGSMGKAAQEPSGGWSSWANFVSGTDQMGKLQALTMALTPAPM